MKKGMEIIVKTPLGLESIVGSRIKEIEEGVEVRVRPYGFEGLVIVERCRDKIDLAKRIEDEIPEAEKVIVVEQVVKAELNEMVKAALEIALNKLSSKESFAVRTVRRGKHPFTSIDVNVKAGAEIVDKIGSPVNLDYPDKIIQIEILQDQAGIAILDGKSEWRKMDEHKFPSHRFFRKISVVQMPYLGSAEGAREIGARIGRAVQTYEVRELVISPNKPVDAFELALFIRGVEEGIESRYNIQKRSYARKIEKVKVIVQDLYQLVRERRAEPIVVFEPEGKQLRDIADKLVAIFRNNKRINFLLGSREGIPKGVYRLADMVIDLASDITLPTELAAPAALTAVYTVLNLKILNLNGDEQE